VRTPHIKIWQTFLGLLVVSSLACGGGDSNKGGCGDGSCADGGAGGLDGALGSPDLPSTTPDQAGPTVDAQSIDQLASAVDLASMATDGGVDADAAADAAADKPSDLPWGREVQKRDAPQKADYPRDLLQKRDGPADQANKRDARDLAPDLTPDAAEEVDAAPGLDAAPTLDSAALDTTAMDTGNADTDPTLPVVVPDKLVYSPGDDLTATWNNGSDHTSAWIGTFVVESADADYLHGQGVYWDYTNGILTGTLDLKAPSNAGTYELRMFKDAGYTRIATSLPFVVE
jgi:hypothetical protein